METERAVGQVTAIGLMSGTSCDGVDVALIETDGKQIGRFGPTGYRPYSEEERRLLRRAVAAARNIADRSDQPVPLREAEALVTAAHAEAVEAFLKANGILQSAVAVIGFHGQTVLHDPERRLTLQLGDGHALAAQLKIPVVYDFRSADVAAGGQGAPLVPVFHRALARLLSRPFPIAVLNVGGVANLTYIDQGADLLAFDTGPGNALIDDFLRMRTGQTQDTDGKAAAAGRIDATVVARILAHPFFGRRPPKSLDRDEFGGLLAGETLASARTEDGAATLTAFTAAAVAQALRFLPRAPACWMVAGGGARNPTLMHMLKERLAPASVEPAEAAGWSADALEAQAFAYLAVRSLRGLALTFPSTTGAPRMLTGGVLAGVARR
ncbi:MAG TPA: anhydro-N-acetylmuramic acid kinase [Xanthobacteraceae bacterium]|jgi:anhydro-N-acetylmuramic acid kinase